MPTVPTYEIQVRDRALPGARFSQAGDLEAFGGGQSFQQVSNATNQFIQEKIQEADDIATTEAYSEVVLTKNKLIYDPENGAMTRKGKNAIGSVENYGEQFDKEMERIEGGLKNRRQQQLFNRIRLREATQLNSALQRHEFSEHQKYDQETTVAAIAASRDDAIKNYQDEGKVSESLQIQLAAIDAHGQRNGLSQESITQQKEEAISSTHSGVLSRMINNNQNELAKAYFQEVKGKLTGKDSVTIEKQLEVGLLRGNSQLKTDEIMEKGLNLRDSLDIARKIKDPELRDSTVSRIKTRFSENNAIQSKQKEIIYKQAADILEQTGDRDSIPADIWVSLSLSERNSIDSRARQLASGTPVSTDWKVYYDLKTAASNQGTRNKFLRENLLAHRHKLGDGEFKELVKLQTSLRQGDQKALKEITGYRTENQIVTDTLKAVGLDPKKDAEQVALLKRRVDEEIADFVERTNKKPSTSEVQSIVDNLVVKGEVDGFFYNPNRFLFEVEQGDVFLIEQKDIPRNERLKIEEALRVNNIPITQDNVIDLYNRKIQRTLENAN